MLSHDETLPATCSHGMDPEGTTPRAERPAERAAAWAPLRVERERADPERGGRGQTGGCQRRAGVWGVGGARTPTVKPPVPGVTYGAGLRLTRRCSASESCRAGQVGGS